MQKKIQEKYIGNSLYYTPIYIFKKTKWVQPNELKMPALAQNVYHTKV